MRHYFRQLAHHPGFSVVAILTVAVAAGLNGWGFSFLNAILFAPSPIPHPSQVVALDRTKPASANAPWSPADFDDLRRSHPFLAETAAYSFVGFNFAAPGLPSEHLRALQVSGDFFHLLGIQPLLGRAITPRDNVTGAGPVTVLSEYFWRRRFDSDPGVIGRSIRLNGQPVTIVGVMPARFDSPFLWGTISLYTPLSVDPWTDRSNAWLTVIGRLKDRQTIREGQAAVTVFANELARQYPQNDAQAGIHLTAWELLRRGGLLNRNIFIFAMGMSLAVLLVACANLANLQLARAAGRTREFGVRLAMGASRWRLALQLLGENIVLSAIGGALGVFLAQWGMRWTVAAISRQEFLASDAFHFGPAAAAVVFGLALLSGLIFGIMPALLAARTDINGALKQGGRGATDGASRHRLRNSLIVTEIAVSLMLLSIACYFITGLQRFLTEDWGWQPQQLLVANLELPWNRAYSTDAQCRQFYRRLDESLNAVEGVKSAAVAAWLPANHIWLTHRLAVDGAVPPPAGREPEAYEDPVSPGYFSALGMNVLSGRAFDSFDREHAAPVVIINQSMARSLWPKGSALHHRIRYLDGSETQWAEVVGVVDDVRSGLDLFVPPETAWQTYRPLSQVPTSNAHSLSVALRVAPDAPAVADSVRRAVARLDPDLPVFGLMTAPEALRQILSGVNVLSQSLTAMGLFGILLASIGIYGVIANLVSRRTAEIGIRIALGAAPRQVLALVVGNGLRISATGALLGALLSYGLFCLLAAILPGLTSAGLVLVGAVTLFMIVVALLASWIPARRAARVDPVIALRAE